VLGVLFRKQTSTFHHKKYFVATTLSFLVLVLIAKPASATGQFDEIDVPYNSLPADIIMYPDVSVVPGDSIKVVVSTRPQRQGQ